MPHRAQRIDRRLDHLPAGLAVDRRDETDPAGVVLVGRIVQAMTCQMSRVSLVRDEPLRCRCLWDAIEPLLKMPRPAPALWPEGARESPRRHRARRAPPHHQRGAAHDVAAREHAVHAGHHGLPVDPHGAPARHLQLGLVEQHGRSSGSKPSALITRSASITKRIGDRLRLAPPGRIGCAQAHAHGAHGAYVRVT